jgi:2-amino-4-hydroxy-6-hydroxymethyldihydropteridine diphosphokinase
MTEIRSIAHIALGGNQSTDVGSPRDNLSAAISRLSEHGLAIRAISRFFNTPCFPAGAGPDFVNAAVSAEFSGTPDQLLSILHKVEAEFHRRRVTRWGARTLDLDLLAFGQSVMPDTEVFDQWRLLAPEEQMQQAPGQLILPHPRLQDRAFVLVPLRDIAPGWVHPVLNKSVSQMCDALPAGEIAEVVPI